MKEGDSRQHVPVRLDLDMLRRERLLEEELAQRGVRYQNQVSRPLPLSIWLMPGIVASTTPPGARIRCAVRKTARTS